MYGRGDRRVVRGFDDVMMIVDWSYADGDNECVVCCGVCCVVCE